MGSESQRGRSCRGLLPSPLVDMVPNVQEVARVDPSPIGRRTPGVTSTWIGACSVERLEPLLRLPVAGLAGVSRPPPSVVSRAAGRLTEASTGAKPVSVTEPDVSGPGLEGTPRRLSPS